MIARPLRVAALLAASAASAALAALSCSSNNAASAIAGKPPAAGERFETRCVPDKLDDHPLIVTLAAADKLAMESRLRSGPLVVRYRDCNVTLLSRCTMKGSYAYVGGTLKRDTVAAKNEDELFAQIPVGAVGLAAKVRQNGSVSVAMAMVGRFESDAGTPERAGLEGDCQGATHWVSAVTVGAYRMAAGTNAAARAEAALFGAAAGGSSTSSYESLSEDGDGKACAVASDGDAKPPRACGALLRLDVQALR